MIVDSCALAGVIWSLATQNAEKHVVAWGVAAIFVAIAVPYSLHDIHLHMMNYVIPKYQKYYIRILWMVPIYSIESWVALRFKKEVGTFHCTEIFPSTKKKLKLRSKNKYFFSSPGMHV